MDVGPRKLCGGSVAKIRPGKSGKGAASARFALLTAPYLVPTGIPERSMNTTGCHDPERGGARRGAFKERLSDEDARELGSGIIISWHSHELNAPGLSVVAALIRRN